MKTWIIEASVTEAGSDENDDAEILRKRIVIPVPPFVGLHVGGVTIASVYVLQAGRESIDVEMEPVTDSHFRILRDMHGWT